MKKKISLLLALALCLTLLPCAYASNSTFSDVPSDHWAYDAIMEANNDGVMTGTASGVFSPSGKLNMAQFVTVLTRAFYNEDVQSSIRNDTWPNRNYDAAEKHNLFSGLTQWHAELEVTREVMAQMMYNVMVDRGIVLPNTQELASTISNIPDSSAIDAAFQTAVTTCYYWDLLSGTDASGSFSPKGLINRAQTAVIYTRLKKAVNVLSMGTPENSGTPATNTTTPGTAQNPGDTQSPQATTEATLTNGMPVTEENVLALIEEYKNGTREPGEKAKEAGFTSYAKTKPTQHYDPYEPPYYIAGLGSGTECAKFAFAFWDDIFGDAPYREITDLWQVRPGDLVHAPGHWYIAVKSSFSSPDHSDPCTQSVGGGKSGSIGWGDPGGRLNSDTVISVYTRYPLPYEFENSEVHITVTGPIGTPLASLNDLDSVRLWASKDGESKDFDLPIIWDKSGEYSGRKSN